MQHPVSKLDRTVTTLLSIHKDPLAIIDREFRVWATSPAFSRFMEWNPSHSTGKILLNHFDRRSQVLLQRQFKSFGKHGFEEFKAPVVITIAAQKEVACILRLMTLSRGTDQPDQFLLILDIDNQQGVDIQGNPIKNEQSFLRKLIDINPNFIFAKDREGRYILVNKAMAEAYGVSPDDMIGKKDQDFHINEYEASRYLDDDLEVMDSLMSKHILRENFIDAAGKHHYLQIVKVPITGKDGRANEVLGVATDVTRRVKMEDALEESEERFRKFFEFSPMGIVIRDIENGKITQANKKLAGLFGYSEKELAGMHREIFTLKEDEKYRQSQTGKLVNGDIASFHTQKQYQKKDGSSVWCKTTRSLVSINNRTYIIGFIEDISEQKATMAALAESESRYRNLFQNNNDAILVYDANTKRFTTCNKRADEMFGYQEKEFKHLGPQHITPRVQPDGRLTKEIAKDNDKLIRQGTNISFELVHKRKNGELFESEISILPMDVHKEALAIVVIRDISERKRHERQIQASEALQRAFINALPDQKFRVSRNGLILAVYEGYDHGQAVPVRIERPEGKNLSTYFPGDLLDPLMQAIRKSLETRKVQSFEYQFGEEQGENHFEFRINAIDTDQCLIVIRNISDLKRAQIELEDKVNELNEKNEELKKYIKSNLQLENFAYIASHDLKEPLRTISGFTQLLNYRYQEVFDERGKEYLDFISTGVNNMNRLIEDLLEFSKVSTGEDQIEQINLRRQLYITVNALHQQISDNRAVVDIEDIPEMVYANKTLIQLFQNLITNAIKFKREEVAPIVKITCTDIGRYFQFSVADNGIGIKQEYYDRIFLLGKKLHPSSQFEGTGIGLALCKKIVEKHQGRIWVESKFGQGTTFHFTLPKR
ncbi:MAG: PAS domain S-box protein [Bacteroidota bacterium]